MVRLYTEVMLSKDAMNQAGKYFLATLLKKGDALRRSCFRESQTEYANSAFP